jgi:Protein phosphatase 2C
VQISHATRSTPGRGNEDYVAAGPDWAMVLDGATAPAGVSSGCIHDVRWLVRTLAAALGRRLITAGPAPTGPAPAAPAPAAPAPAAPAPAGPAPAGPGPADPAPADPAPLADLLAGAIAETRDAHAGTCDLASPDSPSATVSVARAGNGRLDYLVLCDSPLLLRHRDGQVTLITDDRLAQLPGGRPYGTTLLRERRNKPGGFWVASTDPGAAYQAVRGSVRLDSVTDAVLLTDGVTRLAEWYGYSWPDIFARLRDAGPAGLIDLVRSAEAASPRPGVKQHDDATAVHLRF